MQQKKKSNKNSRERKHRMQITDIKIRKFFDDGPMKAVVSVTFDDCLAVHDIKVIYARDRYFIVMPSRKTNKCKTLLNIKGLSSQKMIR